MIVTAKTHVKVDFTQLPPVPTFVDDDSDTSQHGVLIEHDTNFKYLDVIGITSDNGKNKIITEVKKWMLVEGTWIERDFRRLQDEEKQFPKYLESQQFQIETTRAKLIQVINMQVAVGIYKNVPHFIEDNSAEFDAAWNEDGSLKSGYYRAYDFFSYEAQDFSKNYLQIAQIMAKYPAVGQGYTI